MEKKPDILTIYHRAILDEEFLSDNPFGITMPDRLDGFIFGVFLEPDEKGSEKLVPKLVYCGGGQLPSCTRYFQFLEETSEIDPEKHSYIDSLVCGGMLSHLFEVHGYAGP